MLVITVWAAGCGLEKSRSTQFAPAGPGLISVSTTHSLRSKPVRSLQRPAFIKGPHRVLASRCGVPWLGDDLASTSLVARLPAESFPGVN